MMCGYHTLTLQNITQILADDSLLKQNEEAPFLKWVTTGDEKWILFTNVTKRGSWGKSNELCQVTSRGELNPKKVMFCVWWEYKKVIYYELLLPNQE